MTDRRARLLSSLDYHLLCCAIALAIIKLIPCCVLFQLVYSSWIPWLVGAWSLQLGCKLPKELGKQS
jgi:hypothetical protein